MSETDYRNKLMSHYGEHVLDSTREFFPESYARTAKRFRKIYGSFVRPLAAARVLDVGCGDGHFLYYLQQEGFTKLEGIDSSESRLVRSRKYVKANVQQADAFTWLKEHRGAYDLVICNHMIEHFTDPKLFELMEGLTGAVAPGGALLLTTPNACTPWAGYNHYSDLTHVRLFTTDSLTQLIAMYGFGVEFYPEAAVPYDLPTTARWLLWKVREAWLKLDFRIQIGGARGHQKTPFMVCPNVIALARPAGSANGNA